MTFLEKVKMLEKLAELGAGDRLIDQALSKLLRYAEEKEQKDLDGIAAKLRFLEEQFSMDSELFYEKFHKGELGDKEEFFRWDALIEMQRRITQRLAVLHG